MALSSSIICVLLCSFVFWYQPSDERCVAGTEREKQQQKSKGGLGAGAIVGICIVLLLIIGMAAWCVYAYRNPTTKSGLFLIDVSATRLFLYLVCSQFWPEPQLWIESVWFVLLFYLSVYSFVVIIIFRLLSEIYMQV